MALTIQLKCFLHPRYNPMFGGEQAIRGACVRCMGLLELYRAYLNIRQSRFGQEEDAIEPHSNS